MIADKRVSSVIFFL